MIEGNPWARYAEKAIAEASLADYAQVNALLAIAREVERLRELIEALVKVSKDFEQTEGGE